ncbi:MAG: MFS transporter [Dehalococcoidales bacterium]
MKIKSLHYGWVMAIIGFFVLSTNAIAVFGFGVFLKPLTAEFGWDRGALSGAFALSSLLTGIFSLICGRLSDRYGPRTLVTIAGLLISAGFLMMSQINQLWQVYVVWAFIGSGIGFSATPIISSIPRWFTSKRGIATSIPLAGFNFGATFGPLLIQWLISSHSWQQAFKVLGFIPILLTIPLAQFTKRDPQQINLKPYGEDKPVLTPSSVAPASSGLTFGQILRTWRFWVFGGIQFSHGFFMQIIVIHIAPHASDAGLSALVAASILSIVAGSRIIGVLGTGFLSDRLNGRLLLSVLFTFLTLGLVWLLFAENATGFYLFAIVFGLTSGGIIPLFTLVPAELFGLRNLGAVSGSFLLLATVGGAIGSPLAGYIFDVSGSYNTAFIAGASIATMAFILSLVILRFGKKGNDR